MRYHISIIIPVLNENQYIGKLLKHLETASSSKNIAEIIIVDGGSTDNSINIISQFKDVILIHSEKGRAKQMNKGAKVAKGSVLYFLHADSLPPKHFDTLIINQIQQNNQAGCFKMQFDSTHWWLRLAGWLTKFNWRICRGGDQSLFITKTLFDNIGGYNERYSIYEDNILINELYNRKQFVVINKNLKSSARMYQKHGVWKIQYYYWSIYFKRWLGADAETLYKYYKKKIC